MGADAPDPDLGGQAMIIVIILGVVILMALLHIPLSALGVIGTIVGLWWLSVKIWPRKTCRRCQGSGVRQGPFSFVRTCHDCQGSGTIPRIGSGE